MNKFFDLEKLIVMRSGIERFKMIMGVCVLQVEWLMIGLDIEDRKPYERRMVRLENLDFYEF